MLFEVAPETSARRLAEALYAAEAHQDARQLLDDATFFRLRADAAALAAIVPYALLCLAEQLIEHPRSTVRLETIRLLALVHDQDPPRVETALRRLAGDAARGVQKAAEQMLARG